MCDTIIQNAQGVSFLKENRIALCFTFERKDLSDEACFPIKDELRIRENHFYPYESDEDDE
jgi:hypothetical protein